MAPLVALVLGCMGSDDNKTTPAPEPGSEPELRVTQPTRPPVIGVQPTPPPKPGEPDAAITADQCDDLTHGGDDAGPDCITAKIKCGETVIGHTFGGGQTFGTRFYDWHKCWPGTIDKDGGDERTYLLEMPAGEHRAEAFLDTPCADLDLAGIKVPSATTCPTMETDIRQCEMSVKKGKRRDSVELVSQSDAPVYWLLVVEGKDAEEGAFALTVKCKEGLHD
jgi:hypothetical protein